MRTRRPETVELEKHGDGRRRCVESSRDSDAKPGSHTEVGVKNFLSAQFARDTNRHREAPQPQHMS